MKAYATLAALASAAALATAGCVPPLAPPGGHPGVPGAGLHKDQDHYSYQQRPLTVEEESIRITAAQDRARPWFEGRDAIARWAPGTECDNVHSRKAEQSIGTLEGMTVLFSKGGAPMQVYEKEAQERHQGLAFEYAEMALRKGCLEEAEQTCKGIIALYEGVLWEGIRDRAAACLDESLNRRLRP